MAVMRVWHVVMLVINFLVFMHMRMILVRIHLSSVGVVMMAVHVMMRMVMQPGRMRVKMVMALIDQQISPCCHQRESQKQQPIG